MPMTVRLSSWVCGDRHCCQPCKTADAVIYDSFLWFFSPPGVVGSHTLLIVLPLNTQRGPSADLQTSPLFIPLLFITLPVDSSCFCPLKAPVPSPQLKKTPGSVWAPPPGARAWKRSPASKLEQSQGSHCLFPISQGLQP